MVVEMEHPTVGDIRVIGNPMHLADTPPSYRLPPPTLGQHTDEILARFGVQRGRHCRDERKSGGLRDSEGRGSKIRRLKIKD